MRGCASERVYSEATKWVRRVQTGLRLLLGMCYKRDETLG